MRLSVVILSYNRREALARTLRELKSACATIAHEIIVVDNASSDGTADALRAEHAGVKLLALDTNIGVEGFNRGVAEAKGEFVLILDDDSWTDPRALVAALAYMDAHGRAGGVALLPVHPVTKRAEWVKAASARGNWPIMGCGNLVRRDAWNAVGGYDASFFLYRNDCDLAMKLLAGGWDVWCDPAWVVWHDSPAADKKSQRWLRLGTRNWVWLVRRHGRGIARILGIASGVLWACRHAGWSTSRLGQVASGAWDGLMRPAAPVPSAVRIDGSAFAEYLRIRRGKR